MRMVLQITSKLSVVQTVSVLILDFWERISGDRVETLLFSNRTGTSVDNGVRKSNNWLDQWQSDKLGTGSRV